MKAHRGERSSAGREEGQNKDLALHRLNHVCQLGVTCCTWVNETKGKPLWESWSKWLTWGWGLGGGGCHFRWTRTQSDINTDFFFLFCFLSFSFVAHPFAKKCDTCCSKNVQVKRQDKNSTVKICQGHQKRFKARIIIIDI